MSKQRPCICVWLCVCGCKQAWCVRCSFCCFTALYQVPHKLIGTLLKNAWLCMNTMQQDTGKSKRSRACRRATDCMMAFASEDNTTRRTSMQTSRYKSQTNKNVFVNNPQRVDGGKGWRWPARFSWERNCHNRKIKAHAQAQHNTHKIKRSWNLFPSYFTNLTAFRRRKNVIVTRDVRG